MVAGIGNPNGAIQVFDQGAPSIITAIANTNISGGVFVYCSGANAVVGSGLDSYSYTDIKAIGDASGTDFNGIALYSAGSNTPIAIATRGIFVVPAGGTVIGGRWVASNGNAVVDASTGGGIVLGRSLVGAASGGFTLVEIK